MAPLMGWIGCRTGQYLAPMRVNEMLEWVMDLRLQVKVVGAAIAVVVVMAVLGVWSGWQLRLLDGQYQTLQRGDVVVSALAQEMKASLMLEMQAAENTWLWGSDPKQFDKYASEFEGRQKDLRSLRVRVDKLAENLSDEERSLLAQYDAGWTAYVDAWGKARVAYGGAGGGKSDAAATIMRDKDRAPAAALDGLMRVADARQQAANDAVSGQVSRLSFVVAVLPGLVTVLGFSTALLFARTMLKSVNDIVEGAERIARTDLQHLVGFARKLAAGDLTSHVEVTAEPIPVLGKDEFGQMAMAFNDMVERLREAGSAFDEMTDGLRDTVGRIARSAEGLAETSEQLGVVAYEAGTAVTQVTEAVQQVAGGSQHNMESARSGSEAMGQLAQAIDGLARGAGDQAHQVQAAGAAARAMAAGVQEVAASADQATEVSKHTREVAENGAQAVQQTVAGMAEIQRIVGDAAVKIEQLGGLGERIGAVVQTIDDIAERTNLLALNAAIEAARAGEHGKGFAVVAGEVRKLAERSSRETRQIAELIQQVQDGTQQAVAAMASGTEKVTEGTNLADQAGQALSEILAAVEATVGQVDGIAMAAQELASDAQRVTEAMTSISAVVEENSASTEEMAGRVSEATGVIQQIATVAGETSTTMEEISASAEEMVAQMQEVAAQAQSLGEMAENMKEIVDSFTFEAGPNSDSAAGIRDAAWRRRYSQPGTTTVPASPRRPVRASSRAQIVAWRPPSRTKR